MRFHLEQPLQGSVEAVEAALIDPGFLAELDTLPKVGHPEVLEQRRDGHEVHQRVRYRFTASLSPAVTKVLDPARLVFVDETTFDLAAHAARFRIVPEHYAERLRCSGTYRFERNGGSSRRIVDGELRVSYPLVGGTIERAIVSGLEEHLADEAALLDRWLERSLGGQ